MQKPKKLPPMCKASLSGRNPEFIKERAVKNPNPIPAICNRQWIKTRSNWARKVRELSMGEREGRHCRWIHEWERLRGLAQVYYFLPLYLTHFKCQINWAISQKFISGFNFWLQCPTKVRSTQLSYILKSCSAKCSAPCIAGSEYGSPTNWRLDKKCSHISS